MPDRLVGLSPRIVPVLPVSVDPVASTTGRTRRETAMATMASQKATWRRNPTSLALTGWSTVPASTPAVLRSTGIAQDRRRLDLP